MKKKTLKTRSSIESIISITFQMNHVFPHTKEEEEEEEEKTHLWNNPKNGYLGFP